MSLVAGGMPVRTYMLGAQPHTSIDRTECLVLISRIRAATLSFEFSTVQCCGPGSRIRTDSSVAPLGGVTLRSALLATLKFASTSERGGW